MNFHPMTSCYRMNNFACTTQLIYSTGGFKPSGETSGLVKAN